MSRRIDPSFLRLAKKKRRTSRPALEAMEPRQLLSVFTVTRSDDGPLSAGVTLRQAIQQANANSGLDTIDFAIPGAGVQTISPTSALPAITDPVIIDGYTQSDSSPNTLAIGDNAVLRIAIDGGQVTSGNILELDTGGSTIRGLAIGNLTGGNAAILVSLGGSTTGGNVISGNFIGTNAAGTTTSGVTTGILISNLPGNTIGGAAPADRNIISGATASNGGIYLLGGSGNLIQGNYIGTDASGNVALGNSFDGIVVSDSSDNTIGGAGGAGNVISGSTNAGIELFADGTVIQGNRIGTNAAGTAALPNVFAGISVQAATVVSIGGAGVGNQISGNTGAGILIQGSTSLVASNLIGTDASGLAPMPNGGAGISLQGASDVTIGGSAADGNTIAFNSAAGIAVTGSTAANNILFNSIHSNSGLGIDLGNDGVTPNDPGDPDIGPNNLQNFPDLTSAVVTGPNLVITGTLDSVSPGTYTVQFFDNNAPDPSGFGEGQHFLGQTSVALSAGPGTFSFSVPLGNVRGGFFTATATSSSGDTSEFSRAIFDGTTVLNTNDSGFGSLRQAILNANATPGVQTIDFNIPGSGVQTISPASALPAITDPVVIDAYTQPGASPNTLNVGDNAVILVQLSGLGAGAGTNGLVVTSGGTTIRGLAIDQFGGAGIRLDTAGGNTIVGDFIGTDAAGTTALANGADGVLVNGTTANTIGGSAPADRNLISGNGSLFAPAVSYPTGQAPVQVASGDFNNDQIADLVVANSGDNTLTILLGQADGTFVSGQVISLGAMPTDVAVKAFSGRLIVTLFDSQTQVGSVVRLLSNSDGTFQPPTTILQTPGERPVAVASASFTNSFGEDVAVAYGQFGSSPGTVRVFLDDGNGGYLPPIQLNAGTDPSDIAAGVVSNSSGLSDLVVSNRGDNTVSIFLTNGDGTFATPTTLAVGSAPSAVAIGDLTNDFKGDIAVANSGSGDVSLLIQKSDGTFNAARNILTGNTPLGVAIGTFQPGSFPEIAVSDAGSNDVAIIPRGGTGSIRPTIHVAVGPGPAGLAVFDTRITSPDGFQTLQGLAVANSGDSSVSTLLPIIDGAAGVHVLGSSATGNAILGNIIGLNAAGTAVLPNAFDGVFLDDAPANTVGGAAATAGNLISGNNGNGVRIAGINASGNLVAGNLIGTAATGAGAITLGNAQSGVLVTSAPSNTISGNLISGNQNNGLVIRGTIVFDQTTGSDTYTDAPHNVIQGNLIGLDSAGTARIQNFGYGILIDAASNVTIGGVSTGAGNVVSGSTNLGIEIRSGSFFDGTTTTQVGGSDILIQGNLIGTNAAGTAAIANVQEGIEIFNGTRITIGGSSAAARNVISGNGDDGIGIRGSSVIGVVGNYIGTDASGMAAIPNGTSPTPAGNVGAGIFLADSPDNTIGGPNPGEGNLISGNMVRGILISRPASTGNIVMGNLIGTDATGTGPLGNTREGIVVHNDATNNVIGIPIGSSLTAGGNTIAFNGTVGVAVEVGDIPEPGISNNNSILGNSIFSNGGIGIDLGNDGVTANDPGDADTGPNNLQNFPDLTSAVVTGANLVITGTLDSVSPGTYTVQFFDNNAPDPSGFGEGQHFLGQTSVTLIAGSGAFSFSVPLVAIQGGFFTATATSSSGDTSEFSRAIFDGTTVLNTNDSGFGSLRQAILNANATPGVQTIDFNIPGEGAQIIRPLSALPSVTDPVIIDATTQPGTIPNSNGPFLPDNATLVVVIDGSLAPAGTDGITIVSGGSTVRGLVIEGFHPSAPSSLDGSGIVLSGGSGNLIEGDFLGTDASGNTGLGNLTGIFVVASSNNTIGGVTPASRNVIANNSHNGIDLFNGSNGNLIANNFVGVGADGLTARPNGDIGVLLNNSNANTVGGSVAGARNLISGNVTAGVDLGGGATGNLIEGNSIGTAVNGPPILGNGSGVVAEGGAHDNLVASNAIGGNSLSGVTVDSTSHGIAIRFNSIESNGGLGIDLNGDGVTPNDPGDLDTGGNNLQNFPVLTSLATGSSSVTIGGTLSSAPNSTYFVDFFENVAPDPTGFGEGSIYLGSATVTTDASGNASFSQSFGSFSGTFFTATATDAAGNTSEFSRDLSSLITVEGTPFVGVQLGTFTSDNPSAPPSQFTATIDWGDGTTGDPGTITQPGGPGTPFVVSGTHNYLEEGGYTITITVDNFNGPTIVLTNVAYVADAPLIMPTGATISGKAGVPLDGVSLGTFGDANVFAPLTDFAATIDWGDGTQATPGNVVPLMSNSDAFSLWGVIGSHTYASPGNFAIAIFVRDIGGSTTTINSSAIIAPAGTDVGIGLSASPEPVFVGADLTYTITLTNHGQSAASRVVVTDTLPAGVDFVSTSSPFQSSFTPAQSNGQPATVTFAIPNLAPGQSATMIIIVQPNTDGTLIDTATFTSSQPDTTPIDNTATVSSTAVFSFVVTNTNDSGFGSLRRAILNANKHPGIETISFNLPSGSPLTIAPLSPLPAIFGPTVVDATTEPGFAGTPLVILDGTSVKSTASGSASDGGFNGLNVFNGVTVRGLSIQDFPGSGIAIIGGANSLIVGNILNNNRENGVYVRATLFFGQPGHQAVNNTIGGTAPGDANVISHNDQVGIQLSQHATGTLIQGNIIGSDGSGEVADGNLFDGIFLDNAQDTTIGGTASGARNLISNSGEVGIQVFGPDSTRNLILGNIIGPDLAGTRALINPNGRVSTPTTIGVWINGAPGNIVGGPALGSMNLISGNDAGVEISGAGATGNLVVGNRIGTDITGTASLPNQFGVFISAASNNTIGGTGPGLSNLISGNSTLGVRISDPTSRGNVVLGNFVGTDAAGTNPLGNTNDGVLIEGSPSNTIGPRNVISGNGDVDLQIHGATASGNVVIGNFIGTTLDAPTGSTTPFGPPRGKVGLLISDAPNNTVGGTSAGAGNLIANHPDAGLEVLGAGSTNNVTQGNTIRDNPNYGIIANVNGGNVIPLMGTGANTLVNNGRNFFPLNGVSPLVLGVGATPNGAALGAIVVSYNSPMDPKRATILRNYRIDILNARGRRIGSSTVKSATYDDATMTVTLAPSKALPAGGRYRLFVSGTGRKGVTDSGGHLIDGNTDGNPGGNFLGSVTVAGGSAGITATRLHARDWNRPFHVKRWRHH